MRIDRAAIVMLCLALPVAASVAGDHRGGFSIVARDAATGDLGVALASLAPVSAGLSIHAREGVGVVVSSGGDGPDLGARVLDLLAGKTAPREALAGLLETDTLPERRQIGVVDAGGASATHTGRQTTGWSGAIEATGFCVVGERLAGRATLEAMAASYVSTEGSGLALGERLLQALEAGRDAGAERGLWRSAALRVVPAEPGRRAASTGDLRVDDADHPVRELRRIHDTVAGVLGHRRLAQAAGPDVAELQRLLKAAGVFAGEPNGVFDDATVAAVETFRRTHGMHTGDAAGGRGLVDAELIRRLREASRGAAPGAAERRSPR